MNCARVLWMPIAFVLCTIASCAASAANPVAGDPLTGSGAVTRTLVTYAQLTTTQTPGAPVDDGAFALPTQGAMPADSFSGTLTLTSPSFNGSFTELRDDFGYAGPGAAAIKHLPSTTIEFVQNGSHLIPTQQGLIITSSLYWNYIIGPGRAWKENSDNGWSRASFPFALIERNQNCVHNGVMMFLFNATSVSRVRYQITQETCLYFKFNLWGQISATTSRYTVANGETVRNDHATEVSQRLPTKPVAQLATDYPGSGVNVAAFTSDIPTPVHITTWGVLINGVNYVSGCPTRFGQYAYCSQLRLPSYSTAKSAFANIAMMRLGAQFGAGVYGQLVRNFVPEYTNGGNWTNVTFDHLSDMASGNYISSAYQSDEGSQAESDFLVAEPYNQKIVQAFDSFPGKVAPGTQWVYHSHDTFILTQALRGYLGSDLFNKVRDDVYKPLHLSKGGLTTLRTDNSATGRPIGSWGLFYNQDDIAKISKLLNNDLGVINGSPVLDTARVQESLFRTAALGLEVPIDTSHTWRYLNGFWGKVMTPGEFPGIYSCTFNVARMGGYGGISVVLMPNGTTYYIFSDNDEFAWYNAVRESHKIIPQC